MRNAIDECVATSNNFDEFHSKLLEQFHISVIEHRGRYSYLHPDRQKHGFDTQSDLKNTLVVSKQELNEMQTQFAQHRSDLRILNDQIRYTGQYYANKEVYSQFSKAKYKGKYRKEHAKEIQKYEEARNWLKSFYQDGNMTSLKTLTLQKEKLQQQIASEEEAISSLKEKLKDLDTADQNVDAILQMQIPEPVRSKNKDLER